MTLVSRSSFRPFCWLCGAGSTVPLCDRTQGLKWHRAWGRMGGQKGELWWCWSDAGCRQAGSPLLHASCICLSPGPHATSEPFRFGPQGPTTGSSYSSFFSCPKAGNHRIKVEMAVLGTVFIWNVEVFNPGILCAFQPRRQLQYQQKF